ncbi:MAG: low specificity L-threonine aldolase [Armatimonadetes bacterium]|nr:low specificity L-threonine aldolase [Armatimonadota bacterium]
MVTTRSRQFASDNYAGICPEAMAAMMAANAGHQRSYGDDPYTQRACDLLRDLFEIDLQAFFVFNGTAANSLAISALCQSYHSVICGELAHVETDECGAPEFFSNGTKMLLASGQDAKIDPLSVEAIVRKRDDIHYPKPRVLSLTQATEVGTVYTPEELAALGHMARKHRLRVHMDGARFANAVASLGVSPKEITWQVGVDVLCFGGAKNGLALGEAVVFFDAQLAEEFDYRCKQAGQLASKMRFLSAPWVTMLENGTWLRHAGHANAMAAELEAGLRAIDGVGFLFPRQANSVFVQLPERAIDSLHQLGWHFYTFIGAGGARLMCSWDTQPEDVAALLADVRQVMAAP